MIVWENSGYRKGEALDDVLEENYNDELNAITDAIYLYRSVKEREIAENDEEI